MRWTFLLWWMLANTVGGAIIGALEEGGFQFFATLFLTGFVLGIAQWLVIRPYIGHTGWWVIASSVGWFLGILLNIMATGILNYIVQLLWAVGGLWEVFWLNLVHEPVTAAVLGVAQWFVLRRHIQHAGRWILASAVGGAVHGAVSAALCAAACQAITMKVSAEMATAVTYGAGWAGYGAVTGIMLVWLLQNRY